MVAVFNPPLVARDGAVPATTTVFTTAGPTSPPDPSSQSRTSAIPIAPIVGGVVSGAALAIFVVLAWIWWGRCLRRKAAKERKEKVRHFFFFLGGGGLEYI
jgi:hypothetical protein